MPLQTSREDLKAMLTLTNLRKWVETWPKRVLAIRASSTCCPLALYLREGQGVLLAEIGSSMMTWCNVDLDGMARYREYPAFGYKKLYENTIYISLVRCNLSLLW